VLLSCSIHPLLGTAQGLQPGQQHPFPWYPPVCTSLSDIPEGPRSGDHVTSVKERTKLPAKMVDAKMKSVSFIYFIVLMNNR